jgi:hypothetical protein
LIVFVVIAALPTVITPPSDTSNVLPLSLSHSLSLLPISLHPPALPPSLISHSPSKPEKKGNTEKKRKKGPSVPSKGINNRRYKIKCTRAQRMFVNYKKGVHTKPQETRRMCKLAGRQQEEEQNGVN